MYECCVRAPKGLSTTHEIQVPRAAGLHSASCQDICVRVSLAICPCDETSCNLCGSAVGFDLAHGHGRHAALAPHPLNDEPDVAIRAEGPVGGAKGGRGLVQLVPPIHARLGVQGEADGEGEEGRQQDGQGLGAG